jgi:hypothetical protein
MGSRRLFRHHAPGWFGGSRAPRGSDGNGGFVSDESFMQAAQLQVVQPGSRASFRRRVVDAMRQLVSAPGAFVCFGTQDIRAYADSTRLVDGQLSPIRKAEGERMSAEFGFDPKSVAAT